MVRPGFISDNERSDKQKKAYYLSVVIIVLKAGNILQLVSLQFFYKPLIRLLVLVLFSYIVEVHLEQWLDCKVRA